MALGRLSAGAGHTQPAATCERNISRSFRKSLTALRMRRATPARAQHGAPPGGPDGAPGCGAGLRVDVDLHGGRRVLHVLGVAAELQPVEGDLTDRRPL